MSEPGPDDELLSAYLDGEVTDGERAAVEASLVSAERRAALAGLAATRDAVRALPEPEMPQGFVAELEQAVAGAPVAVPAPRDARRSEAARGRLALLAGGVAAAVLAAALVIPASDPVDPRVPARLDAHAARASVSDDPVTELAPLAATTAGLRR